VHILGVTTLASDLSGEAVVGDHLFRVHWRWRSTRSQRQPYRPSPLQGLTDFAIAQSYLDTATKWGLDKLDVLRQLLTTDAWFPPALTPAE
jgi:hypothetical protein